MARVTFDTRNNAFFLQLKQEVDQYFTERKLAKTGNWRLYIKSVILIGGTTAMYLLLRCMELVLVGAGVGDKRT